MPALCQGKTRRAEKTADESSTEVERVPKARQDPDRMAGRDFRGQNDAKEARKARLPEAKREGLNARSVSGKTRRASKSQRQKVHVQSAGVQGRGGATSQIPDSYGGKEAGLSAKIRLSRSSKERFKAET